VRRNASRFARRRADGLYPDAQPLERLKQVMCDGPTARDIPEIARYDAGPAR
jgi:hypothetical protein